MSPLNNAGLFLVQVLFNLYIFILLLRILFQKCRVDFYNPMSQWVLKMTNPVLIPVRRYIPSYAGFDIPAMGLLVLLQCIKFSLISVLQAGLFPNLLGLLILAIADSIAQAVNIFFYAIILLVLISWINPLGGNPFTGILTRLTAPLIEPVRRIVPPLGGMDLTPLLVLIALQLINILITEPLFKLGQGFL